MDAAWERWSGRSGAGVGTQRQIAQAGWVCFAASSTEASEQGGGRSGRGGVG